jgi:1-acyl-sn-glycerol-3-phosphate acyltransferase
MLFLRSLLFNLVLWSSSLIFSLLTLFSFPLPPIPRFRFISQWARFGLWWLKVTCRISFQVEGQENLPPGPAIVLCKHQSAWETLATQIIFPPHVWVLKRELLWLPFFGWGLALTQPIAIDRGSIRTGLKQIVEQGRQRLQTGRWVVVFPEGTRMAPREHGRFGVGGAYLASETGYPVVPVAHNAGRYWPRRSFIKQPGTIRVMIGPVIDSRGRKPDEINQSAEDWIKSAMAMLESNYSV